MIRKIALNGPLACGKTKFSEKLKEREGYEILTISIPIKKVSSLLITNHLSLYAYLEKRFQNQMQAEAVFKELKAIQDAFFKDAAFEIDENGQHIKTENYRLLTQKVANRVREMHGQGIWVKFLAQDAEEWIKGGKKVICDDMRVKEEKAYFEAYGFSTIRFDVNRQEQKRRARNRGDGEISDAVLDDPTEHDLDHEMFQYRIDTTPLNEEEVYQMVVQHIKNPEKEEQQ